MPVQPDPEGRYILTMCVCTSHDNPTMGLLLNLDGKPRPIDAIKEEDNLLSDSHAIDADAVIVVPNELTDDPCILVFVRIPDELYHMFPQLDNPTEEQIRERKLAYAAAKTQHGI